MVSLLLSLFGNSLVYVIASFFPSFFVCLLGFTFFKVSVVAFVLVFGVAFAYLVAFLLACLSS